MEPCSLPYRVENGAVLIELRLRHLSQLFNSFDPSPFREKDLDKDAEDYIVGAAREIGIHRRLKLVIHLSAVAMADAGTVAPAIHNYFAYRLEAARRDLRLHLSQGRLSLAIGLAFLVACVSVREVVLSLGDGTIEKILAEGLLISGWVAMWRPIQIYLYDWWPIRRTCDALAVLGRIEVEVQTDSAS